MIKIPIFDSGTPEEWIVFVCPVQKTLVGQKITTVTPIHKCMEQVVKGDAKAEFTQQAYLEGSHTVGNFFTVMATMTVHLFPVLAYQDQKRYLYRFLRKPKTIKVRIFTNRFIQLNNYLPYLSPDRTGEMVTALPDDEVKEILYDTIPN